MQSRQTTRLVTTLWRLAWDAAVLRCAVYRSGTKLEMRLESGSRTLLIEPFELRPRTLARTDALKSSLKRRGWHEEPGPQRR